MQSSFNKPVFLYAEDDFDDFETLKEALMHLSDNYEIVHAKNGVEVQEYLNVAEEMPGIIVLDLNMPVMDGKETLQWLKNEERFEKIPTMIFTTSSREEDVKLCQSHSCTFFRKPTLYRDLLHIVQMMIQMCEENRVKEV
jgi:CheY-like chemotaxis protein